MTSSPLTSASNSSSSLGIRHDTNSITNANSSFEIKEFIGGGSFGYVHKAIWQGKTIAVKIVQLEDDYYRRSFDVEVYQLSSLKHPYIIEFYCFEKRDKLGYILLEFSRDGPLSSLLHGPNGRPYDLRHASMWALQVAKGVAYLHGIKPKPVMHRDLKPANLLLFADGKTIKICDFGIACVQKTSMTRDMGTAAYMALEVLDTSQAKYTELCDVYSWSIIFWEILARQKPYHNSDRTNMFALLNQLMKGMKPEVLEDCPEMIWDLITQSWDRDPKKRPKMSDVVKRMHMICNIAYPQGHSKSQSSSSRTVADHRNQHRRNQQPNESVELRTMLIKCKTLRKHVKKLQDMIDVRSADNSSSSTSYDNLDYFHEAQRLKQKLKDEEDKKSVKRSFLELRDRRRTRSVLDKK